MSVAAIPRVIDLLRSGELATRYGKLVDVRPHPTADLVILNYTPECQYTQHWDEVTCVCRGLIIDTRGWEVAGWPFAKFFNVEERPETRLAVLPDEPFLVLEKIDGSLGISYRAPDGPALATRGSFTSEQAIRGTALLRQLPGLGLLNEHLTYLFEIVYSDNRSVIKYPFEGVVLLAIIQRRSGAELPWFQVEEWAGRLGCRTPRVYSFESFADVLASRACLPADMEGYVIRFASDRRVKLKGDAYLTLHKLVWNLTEKRIGDALAEGTYGQLLRDLPEEFRSEAEALAAPLHQRAAEVESRVRDLFAQAPNDSDRKTFALWVQANCDLPLRAPLFQLRDGRVPNWHALLQRLPGDTGQESAR
jgi:RNA ligase